MTTEAETIKAARNMAAEIIGKAQAELLESARKIAEKHGLPEGINGLSAHEFLGRLSFVVSLSRDLKRAGEELLATEAIKVKFQDEPEGTPDATAKGTPADPDKDVKGTPLSADVSELEIQPITVKALKAAGIHQIQDIHKFTDEALLKVRGIAPPSLQRIRDAVAAYEQRHGS